MSVSTADEEGGAGFLFHDLKDAMRGCSVSVFLCHVGVSVECRAQGVLFTLPLAKTHVVGSNADYLHGIDARTEETLDSTVRTRSGCDLASLRYCLADGTRRLCVPRSFATG